MCVSVYVSGGGGGGGGVDERSHAHLQQCLATGHADTRH